MISLRVVCPRYDTPELGVPPDGLERVQPVRVQDLHQARHCCITMRWRTSWQHHVGIGIVGIGTKGLKPPSSTVPSSVKRRRPRSSWPMSSRPRRSIPSSAKISTARSCCGTRGRGVCTATRPRRWSARPTLRSCTLPKTWPWGNHARSWTLPCTTANGRGSSGASARTASASPP